MYKGKSGLLWCAMHTEEAKTTSKTEAECQWSRVLAT